MGLPGHVVRRLRGLLLPELLRDEGYYGFSVFHHGIGVTADLTATITTWATYSVGRGWTFGGSTCVSGSLKEFFEETALPLKVEVYVQGSVSGNIPVNSSGVVSGSPVLAGSVGANVMQYNFLRRDWNTFCSHSFSLGQKQLASLSINVVPIFQDGINSGASGSGVIV